tara:strand:- start:2510 stop:2842 length:333 start_codon:yes stop_codon:yes gene_type:complete
MYKYELPVKYTNQVEYQKEILKVFDVEDYDEERISKTRRELYEDLIKEKEFNDLFNKARLVLNDLLEDNEWGMVLMLSYDYFDRFHNSVGLFYGKDGAFKSQIEIIKDSL